MIRSVGFVELNSIARGVETADFMAKAAEVKLIFAKSVCPGKYMILISGDVGAVKSSMDVGKEVGGVFVVDEFVLPNISEKVIDGINAVAPIDNLEAIGVVEYFSIAKSIIGADAAAKVADVQIIEIRLGIAIGGKSFFTMTGDVSSVEAAVEAAKNIGIEDGLLVSSCVIPSPISQLYENLI